MNRMRKAMYLVNAAKYLDRHGWTKNWYGDDGGERCVLGAISSATPNRLTTLRMAFTFDRYLVRQGKVDRFSPLRPITWPLIRVTQWNDRKPYYDQFQVTEALRDAAQELG